MRIRISPFAVLALAGAMISGVPAAAGQRIPPNLRLNIPPNATLEEAERLFGGRTDWQSIWYRSMNIDKDKLERIGQCEDLRELGFVSLNEDQVFTAADFEPLFALGKLGLLTFCWMEDDLYPSFLIDRETLFYKEDYVANTHQPGPGASWL